MIGYLNSYANCATVVLQWCDSGKEASFAQTSYSIYFVALLGFSKNCKIQQSGINMGSTLSD